MDSTDLDKVSAVFDIQMDNYLRLVAVVFVLWDHILTLASEVRLFWAKWRTPAAILFFMNRYFAATSCIWVFLFGNTTILSPAGCKQYNLYRQLQLILTQAFVCILLTLRTYALYERSRTVLCIILVAGLGLGAAAGSSLIGQKSSPSLLPEPGCHIALSRETSIRLAVAWEALVAFDTLIFSLTLYKTWTTRRDHETGYGRIPLISMMLRDGTIYYGVMALSNTMNILTFYLLGVCHNNLRNTTTNFIGALSQGRAFFICQQRLGNDDVPTHVEPPPIGCSPIITNDFPFNHRAEVNAICGARKSTSGPCSKMKMNPKFSPHF